MPVLLTGQAEPNHLYVLDSKPENITLHIEPTRTSHHIINIPLESNLEVCIVDSQWIFAPPGIFQDSEAPARLKSGAIVHTATTNTSGSLVSLQPLGVMRDKKYARLTINPFRQKESGTELCSELTITISFNSPFSTPSKEYQNVIADTTRPHVHLFVAPRMFRDALQPLIKWKRQQGFLVEELYTDTNDAPSIKQHLQRRHDISSPFLPPPTFITLVGDVDHIAQWPARHNIAGLIPHHTDLYYAEFTGDYLPDALLGRLSVNDTTQLHDVVAKTVAYEKYSFGDTSQLRRSLLVAGREQRSPAPTVTNGQLNYLKQQLLLADPQHDTICFHNPESENALPQISDALRRGVALVNYTAHCNANGWRMPYLTSSVVDTLSFPQLPFLCINNCCRSNEITGDCFGEHLLRIPNGGAIGVVGASNETLWDEDYYWSVGNKDSLTLFPEWSHDRLGAFDRLLHTHQEEPELRAICQSQLVVGGNWAVTRSGSPYDAFYWEIYSLLGDPSLMPFIGMPIRQNLAVLPFNAGDSSATIVGNPYAFVAATAADSLLGYCLLDSNGHGRLHTLHPLHDTILFTASGQNMIPLQQQVPASLPSGAKVIASEYHLYSCDGQPTSLLTAFDTTFLTIKLINVGTDTAFHHQTLLLANNNVNIIPHTPQDLGIMPPGGNITAVFAISPGGSTPHSSFTMATVCHDSTLWQQTITFPVFTPGAVMSDVSLLLGDSTVSSLRPDTSHTLRVSVFNTGVCTARDISVTLLESDTTIMIDQLQCFDHAFASFSVPPSHCDDSSTFTLRLSLAHDTSYLTARFACDSLPTGLVTDISKAAPSAIVPNPASHHIRINNISEPTMLLLHDIRGRVLGRIDAKPGVPIDISHLSRGVYFISTLSFNNQPTNTFRLVIAR